MVELRGGIAPAARCFTRMHANVLLVTGSRRERCLGRIADCTAMHPVRGVFSPSG